MAQTIVKLPEDFIGKEDEQRLESFGAHLIAHGFATRWHWNRDNGIVVAFEVFRGGAYEEALFAVRRDQEGDFFHLDDASGTQLAYGTLERVMAVGDDIARTRHGEMPA